MLLCYLFAADEMLAWVHEMNFVHVKFIYLHRLTSQPWLSALRLCPLALQLCPSALQLCLSTLRLCPSALRLTLSGLRLTLSALRLAHWACGLLFGVSAGLNTAF